MTRFLVFCVVLSATQAFGQTPTPTPPPAASTVEVRGSIATGAQQLDNSTNSAKLTEYRDLQRNAFVPAFDFSMRDKQAGWYVDLSSVNLTRNDQSVAAEAGAVGRWRVTADWVETPHNFSNKAVTPYLQNTPGLFTVPTTIPITFKKLATAAADTPGVLASDNLIAAFQQRFLAPTPLAMQTNAGHVAFNWSALDSLGLSVVYDRRDKYGSRATYGPIGDRPPRTLNIQLAEPVDYNTNDIALPSIPHDK